MTSGRPWRRTLPALAVWSAACAGGETHPGRQAVPGEDGPRITVEVLNGTTVDGLARRVTRHLRRHGLDVVFFGSADLPSAQTRILVRRGDSTAGIRVREALGVGRVELAPDPRRLLDVTVVLGGDAAAARGDP